MQNNTLPETRQPLEKLVGVPVDHEYTERLIPLLEAHGAVCTTTFTGTYFKPLRGGEGWFRVAYSEYEIQFPQGTYREDGLRLISTTPFTISFPDGFKQFGSVIPRPENQALIILQVPQDQDV